MKKTHKIYIFFVFVILVLLVVIVAIPKIRTSIYYIYLPQPALTEKQVITYMKENGGLMNNASREVVKAVQWYLYKNNKEVALQIFRNLPNEVEPISAKSNKFYGIKDVKGLSFELACNYDRMFSITSEIVFVEIKRLAMSEQLEPSYLHILLTIQRSQGLYPVWYKKDLVYWEKDDMAKQEFKDLLAILYTKYYEWDSIRIEMECFVENNKQIEQTSEDILRALNQEN